MSFPFVQPYFGLGNSLQTAQGGAVGIGGWVEVGRTTLGSAGDDITVSSLPDKRYYMILSDLQDNGSSISSQIRLGNSSIDTGSNYAKRTSKAGGADATATSQSTIDVNTGFAASEDSFNITYIANKSNKEKLIQNWWTSNAAGAGNAPYRIECAAKWANTSNSLDIFNNHNAEAGSYNTGSEAVVLGWDPADTHTTNFWEELASVNASGSSTNLSSGTITAKKYLWVQAYTSDVAGDVNMTFNNVTTSTYARRYSTNGGSDNTGASAANLNNLIGAGNGTKTFGNCFIVNNSANEKLCMFHHIRQNAAGAGTAPTRMESVGKWANTSAQITEIDIDSTSGNFSSNSIIKVWGSD